MVTLYFDDGLIVRAARTFARTSPARLTPSGRCPQLRLLAKARFRPWWKSIAVTVHGAAASARAQRTRRIKPRAADGLNHWGRHRGRPRARARALRTARQSHRHRASRTTCRQRTGPRVAPATRRACRGGFRRSGKIGTCPKGADSALSAAIPPDASAGKNLKRSNPRSSPRMMSAGGRDPRQIRQAPHRAGFGERLGEAGRHDEAAAGTDRIHPADPD